MYIGWFNLVFIIRYQLRKLSLILVRFVERGNIGSRPDLIKEYYLWKEGWHIRYHQAISLSASVLRCSIIQTDHNARHQEAMRHLPGLTVSDPLGVARHAPVSYLRLYFHRNILYIGSWVRSLCGIFSNNYHFLPHSRVKSSL